MARRRREVIGRLFLFDWTKQQAKISELGALRDRRQKDMSSSAPKKKEKHRTRQQKKKGAKGIQEGQIRNALSLYVPV